MRVVVKVFFVFFMSFMYSCERQEGVIDELVVNSNNQVLTKATSSIADFDPLEEIKGVPINIVNVGNSTLKYLSAETNGATVKLVSDDDGSGRQRWYLNSNGEVELKKGNNMCGSSSYPVILSGDKGVYEFDNPTFPVLQCDNRFDSYGVRFVSADDNYQMDWKALRIGAGRIPLHLQPSSENSADLTYKENLFGDYSQWQIIPVGEYRLVGIQYEKAVDLGDYVMEIPRYCTSVLIKDENHSIEHNLEVSQSFSISSTFSETEGLTVQNQQNYKWGFEVPLAYISFGGDVSSTVTSSSSASFGETINKLVSIKHSFKVTVPPHSPCRISIFEMMYSASLTYVLTVEKVSGEERGKQFRVKGKWGGIVCSDLYYEVYDMDNDSLLHTSVIPSDVDHIIIPENAFGNR